MSATVRVSDGADSGGRREAARVLEAVLRHGRSLDRALEALRLEGRTRAAAQDLSYGVLRRYGLLDALARQLLQRPPNDPVTVYLLLIGLHELLEGQTPAYAAVNETVAAAPPRLRGLVNAVLRNFQRRRDELVETARQDPVARWDHPAWWIERLQAQYPQDWQTILTAANGHPPMTLRVNRRRTSLEDCLAELRAAGIEARQSGAWALTLARPQGVADLPGFAAGRVSVQDLGAQYAAPLMDCADGMRVLDACAAPGGKTGHLLELNDLDLIALDLDAGRLRRVEQNLSRLGLSARLLAADAGRPQAWWDGVPFDRILLDAPCTASGVVRRHPDGKWLKRATDATTLARRQAQMLAALWPMLRRGGTLLYATCSLFREENRDQVEAFLGHRPDAREADIVLSGGRRGQLLPDGHHDGFFYARLVKT